MPASRDKNRISSNRGSPGENMRKASPGSRGHRSKPRIHRATIKEEGFTMKES
jgi:hypothetical protein